MADPLFSPPSTRILVDGRPAACPSGKLPYASAGEAVRALQAVQRRRRTSRGDAYQCRLCHRWHLGNAKLFRRPR